MQGWGLGLLFLACLLWIRLGYLVIDQFDAYCVDDVHCPVVAEWPELFGILAASVPLSVIGGALFVGGAVRRQTSAHVLRIIEMERSEERARQKT